MNIRQATKEDIPSLEHLLYQVHDVHACGRPDIFVKGTKKYTKEELEILVEDLTRPIFVGIIDDKIVGYAFCIFQQQTAASMQPIKTLYIDDLCVDETIRGHHVGTNLYNHVLKFAKEEGCYNVTLNVWALNDDAYGFYQKLGLKIQKIGMEHIL